MCGIAGKISFSNRPVQECDIKRMTDVLAHRGPDDQGIYVSPNQNIGLGHRRLSIIDLSKQGHQPMPYLNRYWITYNGEIYNYQVKRKLLEKQGYSFRSQTDTEVILALYDKFGIDCLQHLRGMFAFAIYDQKTNQLFCARDRLGQKPFKYYSDSRVFIFASELKAILTQSEYHKEPDYLAIHHYLTLQYTPAPYTGFKDIKKLEPAHYLIVDLNTGKITNQPYWQLNFSNKLNLSEQQWCNAIMEKLDEATRLRLVSDVPLGAFLSGGIDSSAIVGFMSRHTARPVKTFSIGFKEQAYNELPFAQAVADHFHTDHTNFIVEPQALDILPPLVKQYEEPYADSSALPTYIVSKLTRQHVTVALNGDGGDENFGGYSRYSIQKFALLYEKFRWLNAVIALPISKLAVDKIHNTFFQRAHRFSATIPQDYTHRYVNYVCYFTNEAKRQLYDPTMLKKVWSYDSYNIVANQFRRAQAADKLDQTMYADIKTILVDDFLTKWDIASMAVSLEARSPFLDHKFMELAAKIPSRLKIKGANDRKYIFKKALAGFLPPDIINRPKRGFQVPLDMWFKGKLGVFAQDTLLSKRALNRNLFNQSVVADILHTHQRTNINNSTYIWSLLTLELWFRQYFD
ncbi:MAG: asparagine synthase (glutamine-hydrolyzing) [bacterium]